MQLSISIENKHEGPDGSGPVLVGWFIEKKRGSIIYDPPERVRSAGMSREHAKSASRCPAVINLESRHFMIRCPFDLHLGFSRDKNGKPNLDHLDGNQSAIRTAALGRELHLVNEVEWRYKGVPTFQLSLPYTFISDEPVYASQISPFMHYTKEPLPGTIFGGRFPINAWPRPIMWAFEWHDIERPIKIKRGDPLFYMMFETAPQERSIVLKEAEITRELTEYMDLIGGVSSYVNQTFSLFEAAEARRPETLVKPIERKTTKSGSQTQPKK